MKKTISLVLVLTLGLASGSYSAEGIWTTKSPMPTGRWELSTCVVDGKIYAIGGAGPVYQALRIVEEYDPETDTWTAKSPMPTARSGLSANVVNGKIYVIGGASASSSSYAGLRAFSTVEEYDPATDTWITKSDIPTARYQHSASVVGGKIYVIGGASTYPPWGPVFSLEVYDPATDTWTRKGDMPVAKYTGSTSVVNGKIYTFGGYASRQRVDEYDPVTDTWVRKADMPTYRVAPSASVVGGMIYVIGGHPGSSPYPGLRIVEVYDPATDTWTTAPEMPTGRYTPSTSVVDGKIYAIGGADRWPSTALAKVEEYAPNSLVVDFNGDGIVDSADMCMMVEDWHTDEPFYDIAPRPFGDGIVDVQDLIALSEFFFKDINDPTLVAHWAFDETEGMVVADSAGDNSGYALGDPVWQPDAGLVDGALQLDGVDDYIITGATLNPADGPFSVLAWIKGSKPGQIVVSQQDAANWLLTDPIEGNLMTELKGTGRAGKPLQSKTNITDGNWHRIGFVWDGSNRILYVDGIAVAQDTQQDLGGSDNGLYIGCGKAMEAGTYFSGLIDDVRIYNRVIIP